MNRDMELVRDLLFKIEEQKEPTTLSDFIPHDDTEKFDTAAYHIRMLVEEAAFLRGVCVDSGEGEDWIDLTLTWYGHEFLDTLRDPTIWRHTKEGAKKLGGTGIDMLLSLGKAYLRAEAKKRLGLDLE